MKHATLPLNRKVMDHSQKTADYAADPYLSRGTKAYLHVLNAADRPVESLPVDDARRVLSDVQASVAVDLSGIEEFGMTVRHDRCAVDVTVVRPEESQGLLPCFVFIHGGGWVLGDYPTHKRLVRDLVVHSGCAALFVDYTRSPEAHFPQAIDEVFAVVQWAALHGAQIGIDAQRMALVGNSAGGNMALAVSLRAREAAAPPIRCQILMWPVADSSSDWESYESFGSQRFLTAPLMRWMFDRYTTDPEARKSILLSPVRVPAERLAGLPPTLIAVAENDILRDQGEALGRLLDEAGNEVSTVRFNGVIHDWGMLNGFANLAPTRSLILLSAATLRSYLG